METTKLIEAFYQGRAGNCVSIACIKAGMAKWGVNNIFEELSYQQDGSYSFKMRDGFSSIVRSHELNKASSWSRFYKGDDDACYDMANKYFAAMAKRVLIEGEIDVWGFGNRFKRAIKSLNNGEMYYEGIKWLGLKYNNRTVSTFADINPNNPVVAASDKHCFFIYQNCYDNYGDSKLLTEISNDDMSFQNAKYLIELLQQNFDLSPIMEFKTNDNLPGWFEQRP